MTNPGPQRAAPKSVAAINAEVKQVRREVEMSKKKDWRTDADKFNEWVAINIMGWHYVPLFGCDIGKQGVELHLCPPEYECSFDCRECVPHYSTDPAADYLVLCKVRETLGCKKCSLLTGELHRIWSERRVATMERSLSYADELMYEPGDYSKAAKMVLDSQSAGEVG